MSAQQPVNGPQRRALLVGINYYGKNSLSGCIRDVNDMENILKEQLHVPADNIRTMLGTNPPEDPNKPYPTRTDIIGAFRELTETCSAGDFAYFHFSGHGARVPTVYGKNFQIYDEALKCADQRLIRDVELGVLFKKLAQKGVTFLAVLDCCHSGGALRDDGEHQFKVRGDSNEVDNSASDIPWIGKDLFEQERDEHALKKKDWFNEYREYHLIAACQDTEKAVEFSEQGRTTAQGLLTSTLSEVISQLGQERILQTSYQNLVKTVAARIRRQTLRQQYPVLFGNPSNAIFGLSAVHVQEDRFLARVSSVQGIMRGRLSLNKGRANLIQKDDEYKIFKPDGTDTGLIVKVVNPNRAGGLACQAIVISGDASNVKEGDSAKLLRRSSPTVVAISSTDGVQAPEALEQIQRKWEDYSKDANLKFHFDSNPEDTDFEVRINGDTIFEVIDENGNAFPNLPKLKADDSEHMTENLCRILTHLQNYLSVANIARPDPKAPGPEQLYRFEIERQDNNEVCYVLNFQNLSNRAVFVNIFNLAPDWSITQIFPTRGNPGQAVGPNNQMPPLVQGVRVPGVLRDSLIESNPIQMRDQFKVLISYEQHDFSSFELHPLVNARDGVFRNACPPRVPRWDVIDAEMIESVSQADLDSGLYDDDDDDDD